ncbi:hypothetical protein SAMN05421630_11478 [Prauserella marina]|uniref:Uncharacterized protein n=1 Tax=Prauserella marina TaxID=530584 RepID=A0A1G6YM05_9PSEU|nr:hypothetical protein DES30_11179 [Prauserella marina]SDD90576.1 hypothetical protein SAMN05421630_11478 [Prauserella marina]
MRESRVDVGEIRAHAREFRDGAGEIRVQAREFRSGVGECRVQVREFRIRVGEFRIHVSGTAPAAFGLVSVAVVRAAGVGRRVRSSSVWTWRIGAKSAFNADLAFLSADLAGLSAELDSLSAELDNVSADLARPPGTRAHGRHDAQPCGAAVPHGAAAPTEPRSPTGRASRGAAPTWPHTRTRAVQRPAGLTFSIMPASPRALTDSFSAASVRTFAAVASGAASTSGVPSSPCSRSFGSSGT